MSVMRNVGIAALFATSLTVSPAYATHPLGTEDPGTVDPLALQMEVTGETHHFSDNAETDFGLSLTTGIVPRLDIALKAGYVFLAPDESSKENGIGDLELALKWKLLEEKGNLPGLSLKLASTLSTGNEDKGLGSGGYDLSAALIAGKAFGNVEIYLNLGYTRIDKAVDGDKPDIFAASLAGKWEMIEALALVGEVMYESPGADGEDAPVAMTAGLVWEIANNFSVDIGGRVGLTDTAPKWSVLAGINYTFGGVPPEETREK
jgi:hypothetical protein